MVGGGEEWQKPQPLLRERWLPLDSASCCLIPELLCALGATFLRLPARKLSPVWPQEVGEVSTAF